MVVLGLATSHCRNLTWKFSFEAGTSKGHLPLISLWLLAVFVGTGTRVTPVPSASKKVLKGEVLHLYSCYTHTHTRPHTQVWLWVLRLNPNWWGSKLNPRGWGPQWYEETTASSTDLWFVPETASRKKKVIISKPAGTWKRRPVFISQEGVKVFVGASFTQSSGPPLHWITCSTVGVAANDYRHHSLC